MRGQLTVFVIHQQVLEDHRDVLRDDVVRGGPRHSTDRQCGSQRRFGGREVCRRSDLQRVVAILANGERHKDDKTACNINIFTTPLTRRNL